MTTVFVVDDHPIVAQGVSLALDEVADLAFAGSADSLVTARTRVQRLRPDVVLLDVRLPDTDVVAAVRELRRVSPRSKIVLFTADPRHPLIRAARKAGAKATVAKASAPEKLREVIRSVDAGRTTEHTTPAPLLTPRQHDVLVRVATGLTNIEIADELGLQPTTVKTYWQETMQRLGVRNRAEAITTAYRDGLL